MVTGVSVQSKDLIMSLFPLRIGLIEELSFLLIYKIILIVELLKSLRGILNSIAFVKDLIIFEPFVVVR